MLLTVQHFFTNSGRFYATTTSNSTKRSIMGLILQLSDQEAQLLSLHKRTLLGGDAQIGGFDLWWFKEVSGGYQEVSRAFKGVSCDFRRVPGSQERSKGSQGRFRDSQGRFKVAQKDVRGLAAVLRSISRNQEPSGMLQGVFFFLMARLNVFIQILLLSFI